MEGSGWFGSPSRTCGSPALFPAAPTGEERSAFEGTCFPGVARQAPSSNSACGTSRETAFGVQTRRIQNTQLGHFKRMLGNNASRRGGVRAEEQRLFPSRTRPIPNCSKLTSQLRKSRSCSETTRKSLLRLLLHTIPSTLAHFRPNANKRRDPNPAGKP